jgi:hypothetical protein
MAGGAEPEVPEEGPSSLNFPGPARDERGALPARRS